MHSTQRKPRYVSASADCIPGPMLVTQRSRTQDHPQGAQRYRRGYRVASTPSQASGSRATYFSGHLVSVSTDIIVVNCKLTSHTARAPHGRAIRANEPERIRAPRVPGEYASRLCGWVALGSTPHADTRSSPASAATYSRPEPSRFRGTLAR